MEWTLSTVAPATCATETLALLIGQDDWRKELAAALGPSDALATLASDEGFEGKRGQTFITHASHTPARRVLLVGVNAPSMTGYDLKELGAITSQAARKARTTKLSLWTPWTGEALASRVRLLAEGVELGVYRFDRHKTQKDGAPALARCELLVSEASAALEASLREASALAAGVILARDLSNESPAICTPRFLAETAQRIAHDHEHMHATVLDRAAIEAKGFMLLAAVGRGSSDHHESRFIHLVYKPHGEVKRKVAFVGKGVTFDTGGYCIKPAAGMYGMHGDMGGAAAVLGAAESIGRLQPAGVELHFLVPSTANMINGDAFLLNEIIRGYGGKTVEINNTDAEGRLILADALAYAVELGVDEIVDLATLTGACVVALGDYYTGLFSNNDAAARKVLDASAAAGERVWQMPLDERLRDKLKSGVADMKNTGDRNGGAITAALFLREWVGDKPWVHLDIAGPALAEGDTPLYPRGGTGVGVTTLVRLVS